MRCPFCGVADLEEGQDPNSTDVVVICAACGGCGPHAVTHEDAMTLWTRRSSPPNMSAEDEQRLTAIVCRIAGETAYEGVDQAEMVGDIQWLVLQLQAMRSRAESSRQTLNSIRSRGAIVDKGFIPDVPIGRWITQCGLCSGHGTVYTKDGGERVCPECDGET